VTCAACGADVGRPERVGRRDVCPRCRAELRACRQCRFHDPRLADGCREPQAERVEDKTRANFCDYFAVPDEAGRRGSPSGTSVEGARGDAAAARDALDRLFRR
jgi:hypothetical protein